MLMLNGKTLCGLMLWVSVNVAANVDDTKINVLTKKTSDKDGEKFADIINRNIVIVPSIQYSRQRRNIATTKINLKRSSSTKEFEILREPYNTNENSSFLELLLVADKELYDSLGQNETSVRKHCMDIANIVNALYVKLNIFVTVVGIVVWNDHNEIELSTNGTTTLLKFLEYRRQILGHYPNDYAQLLTKKIFRTRNNGTIVGFTLQDKMCSAGFSGGIVSDHTNEIGIVASAVAHQIGLNFGLDPDRKNCTCIDNPCIMNQYIATKPSLHWSSCSIKQLDSKFNQGINYCLRNKPKKLMPTSYCGNGFVESGEECDCGLPNFCQNTCCNPETCMLHANASCATGKCCDLATCQLKISGNVCREKAGECDLPEYCTGKSEYCPSDYFKRDTEECGNGKAYCYQGSCQSHDDQCRLLWGSLSESIDECYGYINGECGFGRKGMYCSDKDKYCGMVHCKYSDSDSLSFSIKDNAKPKIKYYSNYGDKCRVVNCDFGLNSIDPGLVPDGAKCGHDKMCLKQKCESIESLRTNGTAPECPANCSNHGVCNNNGQCHCDVGFAPPLCNSPGRGGSELSGPATRAPACPANCGYHGVCIKEGHCHCDVGLAPPLCNSTERGGSELSEPATKDKNDNNNTSIRTIYIKIIIYITAFIFILVVSLILIGSVYIWCRYIKRFPNKPKNISRTRIVRSSSSIIEYTKHQSQQIESIYESIVYNQQQSPKPPTKVCHTYENMKNRPLPPIPELPTYNVYSN